MKKHFKIIIMPILIIVLFLITYYLYNSLKERYVEENNVKEKSNNSRIDNNLERAKDFSLNTIDGRIITLSDYKNDTPVVLNFWASWCGPCISELPHFDKLEKEYKQVTFLMVNLENKSTAEKFLQDNKFSFKNVLLDENEKAASVYDIYSIPVTVFIDKQGNIVNTKIGTLSEKTLRAEIEKIIE